jgi:hypothetical protein
LDYHDSSNNSPVNYQEFIDHDEQNTTAAYKTMLSKSNSSPSKSNEDSSDSQ